MIYIKYMQTQRRTKYTAAVQDYMTTAGHATNTQVLAHLQLSFPEVSITTVHRITTRMTEREELHVAPPTRDNAVRFDANLAPHDHFQCLKCDGLRDITIPEHLLQSIQKLTADCQLTGRLNIQGTCQACLGHTEEL